MLYFSNDLKRLGSFGLFSVSNKVQIPSKTSKNQEPWNLDVKQH